MQNENDFMDRLSNKDLDNLIGNLCSARASNPDVVIMDNIMNNPNVIEQEKMTIEKESDIIEEDILNDIAKSGIPLSQEEMNVFKANGLYEKYISKRNNINNQEDNAMKAIEDEIMRGLEEDVTEVISEEVSEVDTSSFQEERTQSTSEVNVIDEDNSVGEDKETAKSVLNNALAFPNFVANSVLDSKPYAGDDDISSLSKEVVDTVNKITSGDAIKEALHIDDTTEEVDEPMSIEELNDVPATTLDVDNNVLTSTLMEKYGDVTSEEAMQLIDVINRYKAGEKFNVFSALPNSLQRVINAEAMTCGADKATINFFAKSFINDLVNNTYLDKEIKDFNKELKEVLEPMNNIAGTMMDEYSDEVYHKFTDKLIDKANEIQEQDPDKAKQLREVSKAFDEAIGLDRIKDLIENTPSSINKAYKTARDNFNSFSLDYDKKVSNVNPTPRLLKFYTMGLKASRVCSGYSDAYINTLIVLVANSVMNAIDKNCLTEHIYAYYASNSMYTVAFTANNSEVNYIISNNIKFILDKIAEYMAPLEARNSKKNRKRKRKG